MNLKKWINQLSSNRSFVILLLAYHASVYARAGLRLDQPWRYIVVGMTVGCAMGLLLRKGWAIKTGIFLLLALALGKFFFYGSNPLAWGPILQALALIYFAWALWRNPDDTWLEDADDSDPSGKDEEDRPMISLVLLRSRARFLEPQVLAHALSEAWDIRIKDADDEEENSDGVIGGQNPLFTVVVTKPMFALFTIHNHEAPYFDEAEEFADKVSNLRFAEAIRSHQSWLAVDFIPSSNQDLPRETAYRWIGKAISALADDDTLALFSPEHSYFNLWSPELEEKLSGESPLSVFAEEVKAPVYGVPDGGSIEEAIGEARRRWPEFVTAFKARQPDDTRYLVKAPFTGEDGETEHMWLEVFGLEPEYVHGHLINDPFHCRKLKKGSQVEVPVAEVSDWICPDAEDNPMGNFTHHVVKQAAKAKTEA